MNWIPAQENPDLLIPFLHFTLQKIFESGEKKLINSYQIMLNK